MLLSEDAAGRVERADQGYLTVRVGGLAALPGNPDGAALRQFGNACAFLVASVPNPVFNHVAGFTASDTGTLPDLALWYWTHGLPLRVDVTPAQAGRGCSTSWPDRAAQTGFYASLYAETAAAITDPVAGVRVEVAEPSEFAQVYVAGFGFPRQRRPTMARSVEVLAGQPGCCFFRARTGTATDGVGLLFLAGGSGQRQPADNGAVWAEGRLHQGDLEPAADQSARVIEVPVTRHEFSRYAGPSPKSTGEPLPIFTPYCWAAWHG